MPRFIIRSPSWLILTVVLAVGAAVITTAQQPNTEDKAPKKKVRGAGNGRKQQPPQPTAEAALLSHRVMQDDTLQRDFPDLCIDAKGVLWTCYIENDGREDTLQLAGSHGDTLVPAAVVSSKPGVLHQPAIACDDNGAVWCIWGQVDDRNVMTLRARCFARNKLDDEITLASSEGSDSFADAGTDRAGRVWVAWQSLRRGQADIFVRWLDPRTKQWSKEISVTHTKEGGHWEPRLAFDDRDGAWIVYDSSTGGEFNLRLARVALDGPVTDKALTDGPEYEARAALCWDRKGGLWITAERGRRQWGMETRGHEIENGLNGQKRLLVGHYDIAAGTFTEVPLHDRGRPAPFPMPSPTFNVNLPCPAVDAAGNLWLAYRACDGVNWRVALMRYDMAAQRWSEPVAVPNSTHGQDRHNEITRTSDGSLWVCWPSDGRVRKDCGISAAHTARIDVEAPLPAAPMDAEATVYHLPEPAPYLNAPTPDRPHDERHTWTAGGKTYRLCFGDLHRHTDISNCRTGGDGCIAEHFRYAYDVAALDFMGTSDHTDVGKKMDPYEWWHTQRMVDAFFSPGKFTSLYAYEREQKQPWGHRNIVFAERGGPVVYISRETYRHSPWQQTFPVKPGVGEITPMELWDVLKRHGKSVSAISHTGATGMGTDWDRYDHIDHQVENIVEIFQGARVSYEGLGTPQPTVGLRTDEPYTPSNKAGPDFIKPPLPITDFGKTFNNGVYQRALSNGHKLGVFASSDHISQHTSFGGVYVEEFTREGIIAGFNARRTIAATDRIFVEFTCNGHLLGSVFETAEKPELEFTIDGTAPLKRITIVRNEQDYHVIEPAKNDRQLQTHYTDAAPLQGENRYYLRVEQSDGNMAWSSPVWVTRKP